MAFDWAWVTTTLDNMVLYLSSPIMTIAWAELWAVFTIFLIAIGLQQAILAMSGQHGLHSLTVSLMRLGWLFLLAYTLLYYWQTPMPGVGRSFRQVLPDFGAELQNVFETARFDATVNRISQITAHLQKPESSIYSLDIPGIMMYVFVELDMWFLGTVTVLPMLAGFVFLGMGAMMFPLVIPCLMIPQFSGFFWGGFNYMLKYSLYPAWGGMLTYLWAGIIWQMLDALILQDMGTEYSLDQFFGKTMLTLLMATVVCAYTVFCLPRNVGEFLSGSTSSGNSFINSITRFRL